MAKMNPAVHDLEGDIKKAITYYENPHELLGRGDLFDGQGRIPGEKKDGTDPLTSLGCNE